MKSAARPRQLRRTVKQTDRSAPTLAYLFTETDVSSIKIGLSHLHFDLHTK